jgi:hypothetical protein
MKKLIIFAVIIAAALLQSCDGAKRIQNKLDKYCKLCPNKDSTVTVIEYRDTTITLPGETVEVIDSVYCDSLGNVYSIRLSEREGKIATLETELRNNRYRSRAVVDTVYKTIKGNTVYVDRTQTKTITVKEKHVPGFINFLAWAGGITLLILLLYLIYRFVKARIVGRTKLF